MQYSNNQHCACEKEHIDKLVQIPFMYSSDNVIGKMTLIAEAVQPVVLLGTVIPEEQALRRTFDENGFRR